MSFPTYPDVANEVLSNFTLNYPTVGSLNEMLELFKIMSPDDTRAHSATLDKLHNTVREFGKVLTKEVTFKQRNRIRTIIREPLDRKNAWNVGGDGSPSFVYDSSEPNGIEKYQEMIRKYSTNSSTSPTTLRESVNINTQVHKLKSPTTAATNAKKATELFIMKIPNVATIRELNDLVNDHYCDILNMNIQFSRSLILVLETHGYDWISCKFVSLDLHSFIPMILSTLTKNRDQILKEYDTVTAYNKATTAPIKIANGNTTPTLVSSNVDHNDLIPDKPTPPRMDPADLIKNVQRLTEELIDFIQTSSTLNSLNRLINDYYCNITRHANKFSFQAKEILDNYNYDWNRMVFHDDVEFDMLLSVLHDEFSTNKEKIISEYVNSINLEYLQAEAEAKARDNYEMSEESEKALVGMNSAQLRNKIDALAAQNEMLTDILDNLVENLKNAAYNSGINGCLGEYYSVVESAGLLSHRVVKGINTILQTHGWKWEDGNHGFQTFVDRGVISHQINCYIADYYKR